MIVKYNFAPVQDIFMWTLAIFGNESGPENAINAPFKPHGLCRHYPTQFIIGQCFMVLLLGDASFS